MRKLETQYFFDFYKQISKQKVFVELLCAVSIEKIYNKKGYPKCLEDLTENEAKRVFGENIFRSYKEDNNLDKVKSGHLMLLKRYKRNKEKISIERLVLDGSKRGYQEEMICDILGSCLAMPEELFYHQILKGKSIKQLFSIFLYPKEGVKLRLIKFFYDNFIVPIERYMENEGIGDPR